MTRDTQGLHADRDLENEADVYGALWEVVSFPRLPADAPSELKKLTIDLDDPKRVYAVHRASRRHNFNLLVERYILQLRYGCQSKTCITPTCFSCRRRLAGGTPVRRYNATSARTLAIYLASQDNPDRGLCHNPSIDLPLQSLSAKLDRKASLARGRSSSGGRSAMAKSSGVGDQPKTVHVLEGSSGDVSSQSQAETSISPEHNLDFDVPPPRDHKSFVQNVFGTVAFRMVEWLTPRNFEIMAQSASSIDTVPFEEAETIRRATPESTPEAENQDDEQISNQPTKTEQPAVKVGPERHDSEKYKLPKKRSSRNLAPSTTSFTNEVKAASLNDAKTISSTPTSIPTNSPIMRKRAESALDVPYPKGILLSPKTENPPDIHPLPRDILPTIPKKRLTRQNTATSPQAPISTNAVNVPKLESKDLPESRIDLPTAKLDGHQHNSDAKKCFEPRLGKKPSPDSRKPLPLIVRLPQSLSYLPIEVIDLLCDILQTDDTDEKHFLQPRRVYEGFKHTQNNAIALKRHRWPELNAGYPVLFKRDWQAFTEQCFFDVLGKPESFLRTFSKDQRLYDTQSIWYLMLRMTRVTPSLVLDSLWNVAGTIFLPPDRLENLSLSNWSREPRSSSNEGKRNVSRSEAAQILYVCLHALVAVVPLVTDARQLANMSRIRSYGLTTLGRDASSLEPVSLCLQYDDVFTDDLALRLARRLFASIPTQRRYAELAEVHNMRNDMDREPDILETVLGSLKDFDLGTAMVLEFPDDERDIHEKRVPTLILDWARTVILQDWEGTAEIPSDGSLGGALAMISAIYKTRQSLLLGDIYFRTEYFAERLDPVEMPLQWLEFEPNKRTIHLLDHPYLFHPSTLVTYFRAINYSRMNQAYETARASGQLIKSHIADGNLLTDIDGRQRLSDRLSTATSRFIVLEIRRNNVLLDTFNAIWRREERELMRPLKIKLGEEEGEQGLDSGGVQQEFFRLAIAEALNPDYGTFTIENRTKMTWFQPGSPEPLWKFELIGMIVSLAVYNGLTLPVTFPKALYRKLLDEEVTELHHIDDGWPDLANGLTTLLEWDEKDGSVEDVFARTYEFSVEQFGQPVSMEMGTAEHWPQFSDLNSVSELSNAPMVTNENRNAFVSDYINWLTDISVRPQFEAFKSGFFSCVCRKSISLFDPSTLQSVVEGVQEIDITELRRATRYIGWDASHRTIRDFWSIVKRYDLEEKKKLLEFVTASDRVPVGGLRNLQFTLQKNGVDKLPTSYTCYGILLLPDYSNKEMLKKNLAMALENSKGFGFA